MQSGVWFRLGTQAVLRVKQDSGSSAVTGFAQLCTSSCSTVFPLVVFTKGQHQGEILAKTNKIKESG